MSAAHAFLQDFAFRAPFEYGFMKTSLKLHVGDYVDIKKLSD